MNNNKLNKFLPFLLVFIFVNALCQIFKTKFAVYKIDYAVLVGANLLLCALSVLYCIIYQKIIKSPNPNVAVRTIMLASLFKLIILATCVLIYIAIAGKGKSVYAIYASMLLYVVYMVLEARTTMKMKKENNASK